MIKKQKPNKKSKKIIKKVKSNIKKSEEQRIIDYSNDFWIDEQYR